jgi:hypothetical protein
MQKDTKLWDLVLLSASSEFELRLAREVNTSVSYSKRSWITVSVWRRTILTDNTEVFHLVTSADLSRCGGPILVAGP